jgi:multiple antibiotic resistance protein
MYPVFKEIISVSLILFSVIDIIGSIPVVVSLRKKVGKIQSGKATIVAGIIMVLFLFVGSSILSLFGLDIESFAVAGAIIMFIIAIEMILGVDLFRYDPSETASASIVPIAFPLIAGAGTLTTILSLKAEFATLNILLGIILNLTLVYIVLKTSGWLERKIGPSGFGILRRVFGIIVLSIAVKLFTTHISH